MPIRYGFDRRRDSGVVDRDDMTNDEPNSNEQNTHDGIYDFDGHRNKAFRIKGKPAIRKAIRSLGEEPSCPICILQRSGDRQMRFGNRRIIHRLGQSS